MTVDDLVRQWMQSVAPADHHVARQTRDRDAATVRALEAYLAQPVERRSLGDL